MSFDALIVDDDKHVRELTRRSLTQEGFTCDEAADGAAALQQLTKKEYDLVIVDLRMPVLNGHAVIVEILRDEDRPCVVALTAVLEPRITKDLLARGIDDICFKPVDFRVFAAKVRGLVQRYRTTVAASKNEAAEQQDEEHETAEQQVQITSQDLRQRFREHALIPPISPAAVRVYNLVRSGGMDAGEVAKVLEQDAALSIQVLKLANSSAFNRSGEAIATIERAVVQLGISRVGELALTGSAIRVIIDRQLAWLDTDLAWKRSVAAAAAAKLLAPKFVAAADEGGIYIAALTHLSGRMALAAMYPQEYQRISRCCQEDNLSLRAAECRYFEFDHAAALAELAAEWNLPRTTYGPLRCAFKPAHGLGQLAEPLQSQVRLLKLSILLGRLAVGRWKPWDTIDLPYPADLDRGGDLQTVMSEVRAAIVEAERISQADVGRHSATAAPAATGTESIAYIALARWKLDFLPGIAASAGVTLMAPAELSTRDHVVVNTIGAGEKDLAQLADLTRKYREVTCLADPAHAKRLSAFGDVLELPVQFAVLEQALNHTNSRAVCLQSSS